MRCYRCEKEVLDMVHTSIVQMMDNIPEDGQLYITRLFITEYLGLTHCVGPEDRFDELGRVVICMNCYTEGVRQYRLHERKFFSVAHDEEIGTLQDVIDTLTGNFGDEMYDQGMIYTEGWYKHPANMVIHTLGMLDSFEYKPQLTLSDLEYVFNAVFIWMDEYGKTCR